MCTFRCVLFKNMVLKAKEGDTKLTLKELTPVRMLNNNFYREIVQLYQENASKEKSNQSTLFPHFITSNWIEKTIK